MSIEYYTKCKIFSSLTRGGSYINNKDLCYVALRDRLISNEIRSMSGLRVTYAKNKGEVEKYKQRIYY